MLGYVIPNRESNDTKADRLEVRDMSRSELSAYLLFFDQVGYFSGFRPRAAFVRIGEPLKLNLPDDTAVHDPASQLVASFFASNQEETVAEAMAIQMRQGFRSAPNTSWVYHPKYFETQAASRLTGKAKAPSVGITFLDGIYCPPDDVPIDDVLRFREDRADKLEAFMQAMFEASENLSIEDHRLILNVPITRVEAALAELNKTAIERWGDKVRRSFSWGIRPNKKTLASLATSIAAYDTFDNFSLSVLIALYGAVEFSVDVTPRLEPHSDFTKAISYAFDVQQRFPNPEMYTRYRLRS